MDKLARPIWWDARDNSWQYTPSEADRHDLPTTATNDVASLGPALDHSENSAQPDSGNPSQDAAVGDPKSNDAGQLGTVSAWIETSRDEWPRQASLWIEQEQDASPARQAEDLPPEEGAVNSTFLTSSALPTHSERIANPQWETLFNPDTTLAPLPCPHCGQAVPPSSGQYGTIAWFCGSCGSRNNIPMDKRELYAGKRVAHVEDQPAHDTRRARSLPTDDVAGIQDRVRGGDRARGGNREGKDDQRLFAYVCPGCGNTDPKQFVTRFGELELQSDQPFAGNQNTEVHCKVCDQSHPLWSGKISADASQPIYHVCPAFARKSIERDGINPSLSQHGRWDNEERGFYAFTDPEEAKWYRNYHGPSHDIWEVTPTHPTIRDSMLTSDADQETTSVYHPEPVGPENVRPYRLADVDDDHLNWAYGSQAKTAAMTPQPYIRGGDYAGYLDWFRQNALEDLLAHQQELPEAGMGWPTSNYSTALRKAIREKQREEDYVSKTQTYDGRTVGGTKEGTIQSVAQDRHRDASVSGGGGIKYGRGSGQSDRAAAAALAPKTYYHVAPKNARESIAQHGLDYTRSDAGPIQTPDGEMLKSNYLYHDINSIHEGYSDLSNHDIYEVDGRDLPVAVDPYEDVEAVHSLQPIEPHRLRRIGKTAAQNVMYHVTTPSSAQELMSHGYSADAPYDRNYPWSDKGLYLWPSYEEAERWALDDRKAPTPSDGIVILTVDPSQADVGTDQFMTDPDYASAHFVSDDLPPQAFSMTKRIASHQAHAQADHPVLPISPPTLSLPSRAYSTFTSNDGINTLIDQGWLPEMQCPYCMNTSVYIDPDQDSNTPTPSAFCAECGKGWALTNTVYDPQAEYKPEWMRTNTGTSTLGHVQNAEDLLGVPIDIAIGVPYGSFHVPQGQGTRRIGGLEDWTPPSMAYHWTTPEVAEKIRSEGIRAQPGGGFLGYHDDEPGVYLTYSKDDPSRFWNYDIFYMHNPTRIGVDLSKLDPDKLGPDHNSGEGVEDFDYGNPENTWEDTARATDNFRYRDHIPPEAITDIQTFPTPRSWKLDREGSFHVSDEQGLAPISVEEVTGEGTHTPEDATQDELARWNVRQPFVYVPRERRVILGQPGMHHGDVMGPISDEDYDVGDYLPDENIGYREGEVTEQVPGAPIFHYESYGAYPHGDEILEALRNHTGRDIRRLEDWHTGSFHLADYNDHIRERLGPYALDPEWYEDSPWNQPDADHEALPPYVYRAMDDQDFRDSMQLGYHQSDERGNYIGQAKDGIWTPAEGEEVPYEGTVAGKWAYPGYISNATSGKGRIVKIRTEPEDGWEPHPDDGGYMRTFKPIPTDRFEAWTDPIDPKTWRTGSFRVSGPELYVHSTQHEFQPGDIVEPASKVGSDGWSDTGAGYDPNYIYMTHPDAFEPDLANPEGYFFPMVDDPGFRHYLVEPQGNVEPDPEAKALKGTEDEGWYHPYWHRAPQARVVRELDWQELANPDRWRTGSFHTGMGQGYYWTPEGEQSRDYPDDWTWPEDPEYVYHAAPLSAMDQIRQEGLRPDASDATKRVWPDARPYIHAHADPDQLIDTYGEFLYDKGGPFTLLKLPGKYFDHYLGRPNPDMGAVDDGSGREQFTHYSEQPIPPHEIQDTGVIWPEPPDPDFVTPSGRRIEW